MKSLQEYVKNRWESNVDFNADETYYEDMFGEDSSWESVCEMLKSHDYNKLIKKLKELYSNYIIDIDPIDIHEGDNLKSIDIYCKDDNSYTNLLHDDNFYNILNFYNYFITHKEDNIISLEPKYSSLANDVVESNDWIAYHFTKRENVDNILKKGLRLKTDKENRRSYPARIYLFVPNSNNLKRHRLTCIQIIKAINHVEEKEEPFKLSDYAILKIDFKHHTYFDFYRDSTMKGNAVFIYENIPPQYIEEIPIDILK